MIKNFIYVALLFATLTSAAQTSKILSSDEMQKNFPATVYFSGQAATAQLRNSAGIRSGEGKQTLFAMVDTGGYSSALRERYQFYILSDAAIEISGKRLAPGAYGAGFLEGTGMLVMDLGGNEIFHTKFSNDPGLKRPRPLLVVADEKTGEYRLYIGRNYITFHQAK